MQANGLNPSNGSNGASKTIRAVRTPENAEAICELTASGFTLAQTCERLGFAQSNVRRWLSSDKEAGALYARAREDQGDYYAQETIRIINEATPENVQVARLQCDVLKWHSSKLNKKLYGADNQTEINNSVVVHNSISAERLAEIQEARREALERV